MRELPFRVIPDLLLATHPPLNHPSGKTCPAFGQYFEGLVPGPARWQPLFCKLD